jgi:hypothetical protein
MLRSMLPQPYIDALRRLQRTPTTDAIPAAQLQALHVLGLVLQRGARWSITSLGKAMLAMHKRSGSGVPIVLQEVKCPTCKFEWDFVDEHEFVYAGEGILCLTGCCFFPVSDDTVTCWAQAHERLVIVPVPHLTVRTAAR